MVHDDLAPAELVDHAVAGGQPHPQLPFVGADSGWAMVQRIRVDHACLMRGLRLVATVASGVNRGYFTRALTSRSTSTAAMMIPPIALPCQNGLTPSRFSPLRIMTMMNTPI